MAALGGKLSLERYAVTMGTLPPDRLSRAILASFGVIILLLAAGLFWIGRSSQREELALARNVTELESKREAVELRSCFEEELQLSKFWNGDATAEGTSNINHMTDIGVRVRDLGRVRNVTITTSRGRDLRVAEIQAIRGCAGESRS